MPWACPAATSSGYSKDVEQETLASRKRWAGRLAAVFYLASGVLSLATLPLSSSDADLAGFAAVSVTAFVIGSAGTN